MPRSARRSLGEWLEWIERLHPKPMELGLERVSRVAERMGVLERLGRTIVVGGTNGKGTVVHLLESMLGALGFEVGATTSPHLHSFNERFRIAGAVASDAAVAEALEAVEAARGDISLTYFEFAELAAFQLFAEAGVDYALIEVGLGGRLDAANVVDADIAVVTSVALDHQAWLGDTREQIAFEKAAISRPGRPLVFGEHDVPAAIADTEARGVRLRYPGRDFDWSAEFAWRCGGQGVSLRAPGQVPPANLAVALDVLHCLDLPLAPGPLQRALSGFAVPGRCQRFSGPVEMLVDVAHNPHAASWLARVLSDGHPGLRKHLLLAGLKDKDCEGVARVLAPGVERISTVTTSGARGLTASELAARVGPVLGYSPVEYDSVSLALQALSAAAEPDELLVVCGCFAVAAQAIEFARQANGMSGPFEHAWETLSSAASLGPA